MKSSNASSRIVSVKKAIKHPEYSHTTKSVNDIALMRLKEEIEWNDLIQPACLPNPDKDSFSGHVATVAGWGKSDREKRFTYVY